MAHLIPLDALLAEIEKLKAEALQKKSQCKRSGLEKIMHQIGAYNKVLSFIATLEVKEADLEKAIKDYMDIHRLHIKDGGRIVFENNDSPNFMCDFRDFAKHFFELGVNASNPLTWEDIKLIWTIGDEIPYMPEEDFFKELLKRFNAQKGG